MIPSVFISSTIADLHYVREVARKVVKDFAMNPVMSDFGEIAYMGGNTAESSCYLSVGDCKLMILIIGRRYGSPSKRNPDLSITENEFDEAQLNKPYLITLVEKDVINFKAVHDKNQGNKMNFPGMDKPEKTFALIDKVNDASQDNGIFPFSNAEDVDRILRLQFAGLFGRLLDEKIRPEKETIKDVLSEIQSIKASFIKKHSDESQKMADVTRGARYLLEERNNWFAKLVNRLGDIEALVTKIKVSKDLPEFVTKLGFKMRISREDLLTRGRGRVSHNFIRYESTYNPDRRLAPMNFGHSSLLEVGWVNTNEFIVNESAYEYLETRFSEMKDKICGVMSETT